MWHRMEAGFCHSFHCATAGFDIQKLAQKVSSSSLFLLIKLMELKLHHADSDILTNEQAHQAAAELTTFVTRHCVSEPTINSVFITKLHMQV